MQQCSPRFVRVRVRIRGSTTRTTSPRGDEMASHAVEEESVSDCTTTPDSDPETGPGGAHQQVSGRRVEEEGASSESDLEGSGGPDHDDDELASAEQSVSSSTPSGRRTSRLENSPGLTPNFRSAAAMAGWDDEALLLAQESPAAAAGVTLKQSTGRGTPSRASCSEDCTQCPQCRERKRATRTPGQAATPLSAGRRHRRVRRVSSNEEPLAPIPMAVLVDEGDKRGASSRTAECSQDKENRDSKPHVKTTGEVTEEAGGGNKIENALQLDKLREELTCVVCLDICFEPSTTTCGHSFCRGCLHSAFQRCGMRCPKCREELRAISKNDCPINTVLWNTIQLLFPQETAARRKDQKQNSENEERSGSQQQQQAEPQLLRPGLVRRRVSRPIPWRELVTSSERARPPLSFGSAPDVWESRQPTPSYPNRFIRVRVRRPASYFRNPEAVRPQSDDVERRIQEEEDAAMVAARLEQSFISDSRS